MKRRIPRIIRPSMRLYFVFLVLFAAVTIFVNDDWRLYVAIGEITVILILALYTLLSTRRRADKLSKYIDSVTGGVGTAARGSLTRAPLPVVIFNMRTRNILWANSQFNDITGMREHFFDFEITDAVPGFSFDWLLAGEGRKAEPVAIGERKFWVYGVMFRAGADGDIESGADGDYVAMTYWADVTAFAVASEEYGLSRPVAAVIAIDTYEEILKNLNERDKSAILSDIDARLTAWADSVDGHLRRYDRDRYMLLFEERHIADMKEDKFSILEAVRGLTGEGGAHASLSIGVGREGKNFKEAVRFAQLALDMALSRGGDQAVIKNKSAFEFFGGNSSGTERRTKVRARVMAAAVSELIADSSGVYIMGHRNADYDSVGAAAGVVAIARAREKPAYIVLDKEPHARAVAEKLVGRLRGADEYGNVFIDASDAMIMADSRSLLVVVDTSRPEETPAPELLLSLIRVAVIDHHRRAATYIENAAPNYIETSASSASELVAEMLQYTVDAGDILRVEAEALLTGIALDTKMFSVHTGGRTFEAAAFLRRLGADTLEVKSMLQADFETAMQRYEIARRAEIVNAKEGIAVAVSTQTGSRISIAQAADELLNISGVTCSFIVSQNEGAVYVSGRSTGRVNVQLILEQLGGGGTHSAAGAQLSGRGAEAAALELKDAIDAYLKENKFKDNT